MRALFKYNIFKEKIIITVSAETTKNNIITLAKNKGSIAIAHYITNAIIKNLL